MKAELNCEINKSLENARKSKAVFVIRAALLSKKLDVALNTAGVERRRSETLRLRSTLNAIRFEFWMKEALPTVENCVLCGWWFWNQFDSINDYIIVLVSRILTGSRPWSISGQTHDWRNQFEVFSSVFLKAFRLKGLLWLQKLTWPDSILLSLWIFISRTRSQLSQVWQ